MISRKGPSVKDRISIENVVLYRGCRGPVALDSLPEALEDDVVGDGLHACLILRVDAVPMSPVGSLPAIVVNQRAVDLATLRCSPESESLRCVMYNQVDELIARTVYRETTREIGWRVLPEGPAIPIGDHPICDFKSPIPSVCAINLNTTVYRSSLPGILPDGNGLCTCSVQVALINRPTVPVGTVPKPNCVARMKRRWLVERCL